MLMYARHLSLADLRIPQIWWWGNILTNLIICHEFFSEFDKGFEICAVFLDFSKAFDKVWHKGLIYKLGR